ncbi:hypothetical protein [Halosegnis sp.]|uniref:DUF7537 family lipoprotein n=1 Tax=Halosegnis sp. TaxID=2864959 RepID=UPI0035D3DEA4
MRTAALVCLLVVLAGCNAPAGGGSVETPAETATPAPVPADETLAPGVTREGVVSPESLAEAHTAALENESYTLIANRTERYANGTVRSGLDLRVELATDRSYASQAATTGPEGPVFLGRPPAGAGFWSNGSVYVRRLARGNSTIYNEFRPLDDGAGTWGYWVRTVPFGGEQADPTSFYTGVFRSIAIESIEQREANGTTAYRLSGGKLRQASFTSEFTDVRNVSLTATVTEQGVVRSLVLRFSGTTDGATVDIEWRVRYQNVSATTVERPPWFDRAVQ